MIQVTCAIIIENGRVLITQNGKDSDHPLQWEFPGGKIQSGESAKQCICREIKEELELEVRIVETMSEVVHDYGIKKIRLIPFVCVIKNGTLKLNNHINKDWIVIAKLNKVDFSEADKRLIDLNENQRILKKYFRE